jgi:LEA14-like dessication related protein
MDEILIFGGIAAALYFFTKGVSLNNLKYIATASSIDISNPLRPVITIQVTVQNPTSGSLTLQSLAGYFSVNGSQAGNISYFTQTVILPNSQTIIPLQLSVNDLDLITIIMNYLNGTSSDVLTISVNATVNVNNVPAPLVLSFTPIA